MQLSTTTFILAMIIISSHIIISQAHTHKNTLRLVLDRGCAGSLNRHSVPGVSTLACGSAGMGTEAPPDEGKMHRERGRSFLEWGDKWWQNGVLR